MAVPHTSSVPKMLAKPLSGVGQFFAMCGLTARASLRGPIQWREFIDQSWFVVSVSLLPTLLVAMPFTVLVVFTLNLLLVEFGAADLSGAGAALGAVTQVGPLVTVLIVAGAGSGKTRVLTRRIAHRAATGAIDPRHVLALTFTRKAAGELNGRLRRLGLRDGDNVFLSLRRARVFNDERTVATTTAAA